MPETRDGREDTGLVEAARRGDERAAERLYERARPRLLRAALALGVHPDDAADVVQETLWSAHRNLARFDAGQASFDGWLGVILVRRARNRWRGLVRRRRLLAALGLSSGPAADPGPRATEARMTLRSLVGRLSPRQREVVALYEIAGFDAAEAGRILGISAAGVRSVARDARRRLAEEERR
jgi:RNA polymerase sigma-70 factor (ECF subfamily)